MGAPREHRAQSSFLLVPIRGGHASLPLTAVEYDVCVCVMHAISSSDRFEVGMRNLG